MHDPVGHRVTCGDAAEDVDEHALHVRVGKDDLQTVRHHLGRGATADVQEVRGTNRSRTRVQLLAGVGDDVERRHDQAGAVADDADLALELDVVEVLLLGPGFQRVSGFLVLERRVVGVPELGVLVQADLAVERKDRPVRCLHQRVDLDQCGVLRGESGPQLLQDVDHLVADGRLEPGRVGDLRGFGRVDAGQRVHWDSRQRLRALHRELLDLDAALDAGHRQVGAVGPVEQEGHVVLLRDVAGLRHQHAMNRVTLDVHAEDGLGLLLRLSRVLSQLHAAGLATPTGLDLGLDHDRGTDLVCDGARAVSCLGYFSRQHRDSMLGEEVLRLILHQIHAGYILVVCVAVRL